MRGWPAAMVTAVLSTALTEVCTLLKLIKDNEFQYDLGLDRLGHRPRDRVDGLAPRPVPVEDQEQGRRARAEARGPPPGATAAGRQLAHSSPIRTTISTTRTRSVSSSGDVGSDGRGLTGPHDRLDNQLRGAPTRSKEFGQRLSLNPDGSPTKALDDSGSGRSVTTGPPTITPHFHFERVSHEGCSRLCRTGQLLAGDHPALRGVSTSRCARSSARAPSSRATGIGRTTTRSQAQPQTASTSTTKRQARWRPTPLRAGQLEGIGDARQAAAHRARWQGSIGGSRDRFIHINNRRSTEDWQGN